METNIIRRVTQLGTNIAVNAIKGIEGDHIYSPDVYVADSGKSDQLKTPLGDKWAQLTSYDPYYNITIEAPIINITRKKTVIKTQVSGLDNSIIQVTSGGDYNISMSFSFITDKTWKRTRDDFENYLNVMKINKEITITNDLLNNKYDIYDVIIENIKDSPNPTYSNIIDVTLSMSKVKKYEMFGKYIENGSISLTSFK